MADFFKNFRKILTRPKVLQLFVKRRKIINTFWILGYENFGIQEYSQGGKRMFKVWEGEISMGICPHSGLSTTNTDTVKRLWGAFNLHKSQSSPCKIIHPLMKNVKKYPKKQPIFCPILDYWQPISCLCHLIHSFQLHNNGL